MGKLILATNGKGGVGKSTLINLLASKTDKSILLNIDQTQSIENINAGGYSVDLIDEDININETIESSLIDNEYVYVDTPSNFKPGQVDYERIISILDHVDLFIIPLKMGKRSVENTLTTIDILFGKDTTSRTKPIKILFILNDIISTGLKSKTLEAAKEYVNKNIINELSTIEFSVDVEDIYIDYFMNSKAIKTIEDDGVTLDDLYSKNKGGYRIVESKVVEITNNIKDILKD